MKSIGIQNNLANRETNLYTSIKSIRLGLPEKLEFDIDAIDFGFAIGYLQELAEEKPDKWWKPIAPLIHQNKWREITTITQTNAVDFIKGTNAIIDWNQMLEITMDDIKKYNIPAPPENFLNQK